MASLANEIIYGNVANVEQLVRPGADLEEMDEYGYTPLIETVIVGSIEKTKLLLSYQPDINKADLTGHTALHWAVNNINYETSELLLTHQANPNAYTSAAQPVLAFPLLRNDFKMKQLLYRYGADLSFAQDFINTKLIGHRYELVGKVDIVNHEGNFIELNLEGFFLESTLAIIKNSLERYIKNFAARKQRALFTKLRKIIYALTISAELIKYQKYTIDIKDFENKIDALLDTELLVIPVAHRGHAITFIKFGNYLAKCDRGENSKVEGSVVVYDVTKPRALNKAFIKSLIYDVQTQHFMAKTIYDVLGLQPLLQIPLPPQITGNCTWANVEASIPTMIFFLFLQEKKSHQMCDIDNYIDAAMSFYYDWVEWDKDRALDECVKSMEGASRARKFSKATLLAAVLFQRCVYPDIRDLERAEKILPVLTSSEYVEILKSYLKVYFKQKKHKAGVNLQNLLEDYGVFIPVN